MSFTFTRPVLALGAACATFMAVPMAAAQTTQPERSATAPGTAFSDRAQMKNWTSDKEQLERELKPGQGKAFYLKALTDRGFQVTSVNADSATRAEYEVVKGDRSYELQLSLAPDGRATGVDITTNIWRSDATKAALRGNTVPAATQYRPGNEAFSDRPRMKNWTDEKERLERALAPGQDRGYYERQLQALGYQVTAVNDRESDYLEYEIVKGGDSFEVQIDLKGGKASKVDVTANVWRADATERALEGAKR